MGVDVDVETVVDVVVRPTTTTTAIHGMIVVGSSSSSRTATSPQQTQLKSRSQLQTQSRILLDQVVVRVVVVPVAVLPVLLQQKHQLHSMLLVQVQKLLAVVVTVPVDMAQHEAADDGVVVAAPAPAPAVVYACKQLSDGLSQT